MRKKMTGFVLMTALIGAGTGCWADNNATGNNNDPVQHPVNAYTNHVVNEDMKDSQENTQKAAEAKATYKQARADYQKSLTDNGADSQITKDARKRMHDARAEMHKYHTKTAIANQQIKTDQIKAQP